jgi:hypothetical protein
MTDDGQDSQTDQTLCSCELGHSFARPLAMRTTRPTARTAHTIIQFLDCPPNPALPSSLLLRTAHPADEFVSCENGNVQPRFFGSVIRSESIGKVIGQFVNFATGQLLRSHDERALRWTAFS